MEFTVPRIRQSGDEVRSHLIEIGRPKWLVSVTREFEGDNLETLIGQKFTGSSPGGWVTGEPMQQDTDTELWSPPTKESPIRSLIDSRLRLSCGRGTTTRQVRQDVVTRLLNNIGSGNPSSWSGAANLGDIDP